MVKEEIKVQNEERMMIKWGRRVDCLFVCFLMWL